MLVPRIPARCWSFCPREPSQLLGVAAAVRDGYATAIGSRRLRGVPSWIGLVAVEAGGTTVHAVGLDGVLDLEGGEHPRLRPCHDRLSAPRRMLDHLAVGPVRDRIVSGPPVHPIGGGTVRIVLEFPFSSGVERCAFSPAVFEAALHQVRTKAIVRTVAVADPVAASRLATARGAEIASLPVGVGVGASVAPASSHPRPAP